MSALNARTHLGPAVYLYRGEELLATFVSESVFKVAMNTPSIWDFNQQARVFLSPLRYPTPPKPITPVEAAASISR